MDPLTCVSLAGTVVQFIDFSCKLISATGELYQDDEFGTTRADAAVAKAVKDYVAATMKDVRDYRFRMQHDFQSEEISADLKGEEVALGTLCRDCDKEADKLIKCLDKLRVPDDSKIKAWKSMQQALLTVWSRKELDAMKQRLLEHRKAVDSRVLLSLGKRIDLSALQQSKRFDSLGRENQRIVAALLNIQNTLTGDLQTQIVTLSQLLSRTEVVIVDQEDRTRSLIVDALQEVITSAATPIEAKKIENLKKEERSIRKSVENELLGRLSFPTITERFEEVAEAHQQTFRWIFRRPEDGVHAGKGKQWSLFPEWLLHGSGLYWINGKAASGKSTLMKYIFTHPDTPRHLKTWAANSPLYIAGFFFWISGTREQKSQIGLLRSLLHDILQQNPRLIPVVFSKQWSLRYSAKLDFSARIGGNETWLLSELKLAFQALLLQDLIPLKLCLFIDGLDEYDGDEYEIGKLFRDVSESHNVKCCVSSRPHLPFQDAFTGQPGLRLEDLTYPDIRRFVSDELEYDDRMQRLTINEPEEAPKLIEEIVTSANGVFLWVKLVVASLLKGLGNHDLISDLQARLREIPKKLEDLYVHMILKVDSVYQEEAARLYQLIAAGTSMRDDDWRIVAPLNIFALALAEDRNPELALTAKRHFLSLADIMSRCKYMASRLTSRTGGLLEIQHGDHSRDRISPRMKVSYLHRTVKDCLDKWETQALLKDRTGGNTRNAFNPNLAIMKSCILQLKALEAARPNDDSRPGEYLNGVITYARRVEADTSSAQVELIDELFTIVPSEWRNDNIAEPVFRGNSSPIKLAVQCGLHQYLRAKLAINNVVTYEQHDKSLGKKPLLHYALTPNIGLERFVSVDVILTLLEFGADPRGRWNTALDYFYGDFRQRNLRSEEQNIYNLRKWAAVIKQFIQAGIKFDANTQERLRDLFVTQPQLWVEIQDILQEKRPKQRRESRFIDKRQCRQQ